MINDDDGNGDDVDCNDDDDGGDDNVGNDDGNVMKMMMAMINSK